MDLLPFSARDLYDGLIKKENFLLLDVRNDEEFARFYVEGPYPFETINVPYMEFIEHEADSVSKVPRRKPLRIVCAKEGSAKYIGEILSQNGHEDVGYLQGGIKTWGNLLVPTPVGKGNGFELYQFIRPGKASCSYGLLCGKEMMVFDPAKNIGAYQTFADDRGCAIIKTFETHRQADYISGSKMLNHATGAEIMAPEPDFKEARFPYTPVGDGEVYSFSGGGPEIRVVHTPGHTPGSTSYVIDGRFLVSGDTVFIFSIGRPDLGGMAEAWSKMLFKTMRETIVPMNDATVVLPGHYMDWKEANSELVFAETLGKIKETNADIYDIAAESDFYRFIKQNMRTQPEEYAKIREINAGLIDVNEEEQDIMDLGKNECAASAAKGS